MNITENDIKNLMKQVEMLKENVDSLDINKDLAEQGIDSLDMLNVYLLIEEKYDVKIPDEDIPKLNTIKAIVDYINERKK